MNIKLNRLKIENFKGVKSFEVELEGDNAVIKAENGVGKTTIADGFSWLHYDKNTEGKTDFEVRPLDANNQPLKGLVVSVEAELDFDGTVHTFRKEQHEKIVKKQKQIRGYETLCWIDEVPKKVGEFKDFIAKYRVMGLAVAFIMGVYLGGLVQALVKDLLMPLIGLGIPRLADLATFTVAVGAQTFGIGDFLVALITFLIVAFVIFILVKVTKKWGIE